MNTTTPKKTHGGYELNPRGNLWYNDQSTLGHKLLAKMGWSKGKGLGKNEDGIKENIKVGIKTNQSGVGWKDKLYTDVHRIEYDALLKNLNEEKFDSGKNSNNNEEKSKKRSLEELSRGFRNRLHYQKFIRGKDVTQYSEQDMKAIFQINSKSENKKSENHIKEKQSITVPENENLNSMDTYKSELSISDYFAQKMKEKKNKLLNKMSSNKLTSSKLDDEEGDLSSMNNVNGFPAKKKKHYEAIIIDNANSIASNEKQRVFSEPTIPKKKRKRSVEKYSMEDASLNGECYENGVHNEISHKKKKKNKCNENSNSCEKYELLESTKAEKYTSLSPDSDPVIEILSTDIEYVSKQLKKEKKKKKKKFKLMNMKSCLKKKSGKYNIKNVTFNDSISYRIINKDNSIFDFSSDSHLIFPSQKECILDVQNDCDSEVTPLEQAEAGQSEAKEEICNDVQIQVEDSAADQSEAKEETCNDIQIHVVESNDSASLDSPSIKSFEFDMWAESQRQAAKMKIYKNMLKGIKKHDVLRTTNLLSIKGYGNWGF